MPDPIPDFNPDPARPAALLAACPAYEPSPLLAVVQADGRRLLAKDETGRMGLGAFKALGGPYAVARLIEERWSAETGVALEPSRFQDDDVRDFAAAMTFVCASAGNHGMGVAAGARLFGARARIHLAATVPEGFAQRLAGVGATVVRSGAAYADSVAAASRDAAETDAILLADGTWPGYTEIPMLVMEGYTVIAEEMRREFERTGIWPSHVYLQAGVGGLAAGIAVMIRRNWSEQPAITVVEPDAAPCLGASAAAGEPIQVAGPDSNMGRLDCKEPSIVAWKALEGCDVTYVTVTDDDGQAAADAMASHDVPTTPSGAAGYAALCRDIATGALSADALPLVIISEGPA